jgi:hypothetical protein
MTVWLWNYLPSWVRALVVAVLNWTAPGRRECPHCPPAVQASCLCSFLAYRAERRQA